MLVLALSLFTRSLPAPTLSFPWGQPSWLSLRTAPPPPLHPHLLHRPQLLSLAPALSTVVPTAVPLFGPSYHLLRSCRFVRLFSTTQTTIPLCTYRHESGNIHLITASDISRVMRASACRLFKLDPIKNKKDLARWSSHSIRVGACVILHGMGFTDTQLQFLLRWKSDAFLCYLRNLSILSQKQNEAITDLSVMPSII